jgi:signal transduction histidine kinase/ActR/RegA family two-component response regulator
MTIAADANGDAARRVLLVAPTAKDAEVTSAILAQSRIVCVACATLHQLSREIEAGVGAILLTEEALTAKGIDEVVDTLNRELPWSEPPIVILTSHPDVSPVRAPMFQALRNVTILERPAPIRSVVSAVQAALRSRERQYQIRDQIQALEAAERRSSQLQQQLQLAIDASELGTFHFELPLDKIVCNDRCKAHFWLPPDAELDFDTFYSTLHPDDRERTRLAVEACVDHGRGYDVEFRTVSQNGAIRWLRATGRTHYDDNGRALRFDGMTQDITESKTRERELSAANRRKDEFLAMLAHELRNPLAPIRNAVEIMRAVGSTDDRINKGSDTISRQVQHLVRLVDDLLDVSRVTQGKVLLQREALELTEVISRGIDLARPLIEARHHKLEVTLPPLGELIVEGDATRLAQVIGNLLDNAAKYTDEGGSIHLRATRDNELVVIRVRDNGVGISPDLLPRVFDLFIQAERSPDRAQGGLGIGLSLVKNLIELHGGTVEARSNGRGNGSEFIVRLPVLQKQWVREATATKHHARRLRRNQRVLVVDDNIDAAETLRMLLEMNGHEVRCAHEGAQAIELAMDFRPDVALLDIGLPRMDGFELARRLRARPEMRDTRLIALTGYGQAEDRSRALAAGFDDHLTKPVDPNALEDLICTSSETGSHAESADR